MYLYLCEYLIVYLYMLRLHWVQWFIYLQAQ